MFRITNISGQVIGLVFAVRPHVYKQVNLPPNGSLVYGSEESQELGLELSNSIGQVMSLCDPVKQILKVEEVE